MGKARSCEEINALKASARLLLSGEPALLARLDDFLMHATVVTGKKVDAGICSQPSSDSTSPATTGPSLSSGSSSTPGDHGEIGSE